MGVTEYFKGKGCVVTGAASGIGLATSEALLQTGAVVFLADRDSKQLAVAVERLRSHGGRVHSMTVDVTKQAQIQQMLQTATSRHGRLDFLFNNAGVGGTLPIEDASLEHWRRIIDLNLWGVVYGVDAALPIMRRQGGGHIVNTSSVAGLVPIPFQAMYCATKYAVVGLSESLRYELEDQGIRFSVVCPGNVATAIWGTPIIGERQQAHPPADSITAEEAAQTLLTGVANNEGIIVIPESARQLWKTYCTAPDVADGLLRDMAKERRRKYQAAKAAKP